VVGNGGYRTQLHGEAPIGQGHAVVFLGPDGHTTGIGLVKGEAEALLTGRLLIIFLNLSAVWDDLRPKYALGTASKRD
jgi:hypothetical protein